MHSKHATSTAQDALDALKLKYPLRPLMITSTEATTDPLPDSPTVQDMTLPDAPSEHISTNGRHHTVTATPPLRLQQPAPKPSIFPSDSDSQHSFTYLCKFSESSTLISLIFVAKSEFSRVLAYPTTRNATKTLPTQRSTPQTGWKCVQSSCGPSSRRI
jgi:hypothetical protein